MPILGARAVRGYSNYLVESRNVEGYPGILRQELESGKTLHVKLELEDNLKTYYIYREWDWESSKPTKEKLKKLNII